MRKVTDTPPEYEHGSTGERIAYHRAKRGLSQKELADMFGISRQTINFYETGERSPTIENLVKIAKKLEVSTDYLLRLTNIASGDVDYMAIQKRLGLSKGAIDLLSVYAKAQEKKPSAHDSVRQKVLNALLDSDYFIEILEKLTHSVTSTKNKVHIDKLYNNLLADTLYNSLNTEDEPAEDGVLEEYDSIIHRENMVADVMLFKATEAFTAFARSLREVDFMDSIVGSFEKKDGDENGKS